jgi:hypothetical protein
MLTFGGNENEMIVVTECSSFGGENMKGKAG